MFIDNNFLYSQ